MIDKISEKNKRKMKMQLRKVSVKWLYGKGIKISPTSMYRLTDIEESSGLVMEQLNLCAHCVMEEYWADTWTEIKPTTYDADCDECGWCLHD